VKPSIYSTSAVLAAVLASTPVQAEITPSEAWEMLTKYAKIYEYDVSVGAISDNGQSMTLSDVVFSNTNEGATISETIPKIDLSQADNGAVLMTVSPEMSAEMKFSSATDGSTTIPVNIALDGFEGTLDKIDGQFSVSYTISGATLTISEFLVDGVSAPVSVNLSLNDATALASIDENFDGAFVSDFSVAALDFTGNFIGEKDGEPTAMSGAGRYQGLVAKSQGNFPAGTNMSDPKAFFTNGVSMAGDISHQGGSFEMSFKEGVDDGRAQFSSDSGAMTFSMGQDGVAFGGSNANVKTAVLSTTMPIPSIALNAESTNFGFKIPLVKSDSLSDFITSIGLNGLTVSEGIWGIIDPSKVLSRDPANLVIDLSGKVAILANLFDDAEMVKVAEPAQLHRLDVNEIRLNIAGADLTGTGAFTFDNDQPSPFGEGPKPTGALDLALTGGNTLIENLVGLGLLPEDQAMAGRMMLGLFATPGEGPDSLTSKIEITEEGGILANGQRLQ